MCPWAILKKRRALMKKSEVEKKNRKTRSDKKRDLKPIVSLELYESMARLAYITCLPMKDIGEKICRAGLNSEKVISLLSAQFRRDYLMNETTLYPGTPNIEKKPCHPSSWRSRQACFSLSPRIL